MEDRWLTTPEAQQWTGLDQSQIRRLCRAGTVRGEKRGRDWFVSSASLLAHLKEWHPDILERIIKRADTS